MNQPYYKLAADVVAEMVRLDAERLAEIGRLQAELEKRTSVGAENVRLRAALSEIEDLKAGGVADESDARWAIRRASEALRALPPTERVTEQISQENHGDGTQHQAP